MKRSSKLLSLCSLAPIFFHASQAQEVDDGEERCIRVSRIDRTEIIDNQRIAFHMRGGDIYLNRLDRECRNLDRGQPFTYSTSTGNLCSSDFITLLDRFGLELRRGLSCGLNVFEPIDEEQLAMLKGEEDEAEITVIPIEVEE